MADPADERQPPWPRPIRPAWRTSTRVLAAGCDLLLNAGPLPGTPSTVVDLTRYAAEGAWNVLREGAVDRRTLARQLDH